MRFLLSLLLLCLFTAKLVVAELQNHQDADDAENAESLKPLKLEGSSDMVPPAKKAMEPPTKSSPSPSPPSQQRLMGKPAIGKDSIPSLPPTPPRAKDVPVRTPGRSAADVTESQEEVPMRRNLPPLAPSRDKTDLGVADNSPLNEKPINGVGLGPQGFSPAGTGPLAGSPPNPGIVPMGPAFDPRAPGPHNGWGYYNEFNYPSRLARPRAFSYNDAQRLVIKASLPFMLASFVLATMYIL